MNAPAKPSSRLVTAEELFQHPEWGRCELVRGRVKQVSPAGASHGSIAGTIFGELYVFCRTHHLGRVFAAETGFLIRRDPDTVRAPDVMFLSAARIPEAGIPKEYLPVPPDLAVEVVSPSDTFSDVSDKARDYVTAGVRLTWVVDPQTRRAYVFRPGRDIEVLTDSQVLQGEDVLPGFELPLATAFR